jgi:hypothetical protein
MPSSWHDSVRAIFTENPEIAVTIACGINGAKAPSGVPLRAETPNFNDRPSTDFEADAVIVAGGTHDPVRAVIVEAQKSRAKDKPQQWARYAAQLWTFLRCPVDLLVVCPDPKTAAWYDRPVSTTLPGYTHLPLILPQSVIPALADPGYATASPAMAALSVAYHGTDPAVCRAFAEGLRQLPPERAAKYNEHAYNIAPLAVQRILEKLMATSAWPVYSPFAKEHYGRGKKEGKAEGRAEGKKEGKAEGEASAVLLVLKTRGLEVSKEQRDRINQCTDLGQLQNWLARAVTADKTHDIFD